ALDRWVSLFQGKVVKALDGIVSKCGFWPKTNKKPKGAAAVRARGRRSPAKTKGKIAAKAAAQRRKAGITLAKKADVSKFKLVVQVDEAHLNKKKPGALQRAARPQKDQVWVRGAARQGRPDIWFFRILDHPNDAFDGKPRGHQEMLTSFHLLGMRKGTILVNDSWTATKSKGWTAKDVEHELVVHSAGEIKNPRGFTTNGLQSVWSVVKRWVRRKCGWRMPYHSDRQKWRDLLAEMQWRKLAATQTLDYGHTFFVPFRSFANTCVPEPQ
ncbi:unnamed protein product, partial [Prorocentrum cordatum]